MDDSLLRTFAQEHGLTFRWKTWKEGERAYADIEVRKDGETVYSARTNCLSDEQYVLTNIMTWAIEDITRDRHDIIVGFGARGKATIP